MSRSALDTMPNMLRDMYPMPGERLKQWVVDSRRETEWERETCPNVRLAEHDDNTGLSCRNAEASVPWTYANDHDCCYVCNDAGKDARSRADVQAWIAEKAARPRIEEDDDKLSNEIEPEWPPNVFESMLSQLGLKP